MTFAMELLHVLGFEESGYVLSLLHHASTIILLVQEDKSELSAGSKVVSEAIALFRRIIVTEFRLVKKACRFP